jgi:integrase
MGPTLDVLGVANWWSQAIVHALTYVTFALSLVHGLRAGSDTGSLWALAFYAALRWENLELDGPTPTITIQHSADTRKQTRVSITKTGEERRVRIGPRMVEVLRRHRAR